MVFDVRRKYSFPLGIEYFRRGNDYVGTTNTRRLSIDKRIANGNDRVRRYSHYGRLASGYFRRGEYLFVDDVICVWRGNDRVGMTNDCGGRGNYLEIPPVFGPLTLRR